MIKKNFNFSSSDGVQIIQLSNRTRYWLNQLTIAKAIGGALSSGDTLKVEVRPFGLDEADPWEELEGADAVDLDKTTSFVFNGLISAIRLTPSGNPSGNTTSYKVVYLGQ